MTSDVYKAPESEIIINQESEAEFYIVSPKKFLILFIATIGLYSVYWFYKHWSQYKLHNNENMWPVMRGIFSIFFAHSLYESIDRKIRDKKLDYLWSPSIVATVYVLFSVVQNVSNQLSTRDIGVPISDLTSIVFFPLIVWSVYKAQLAANIACGIPDGNINNDITPANIFWIVIGAILWLLNGLALFFVVTGQTI
ncbi:hypothetical protein [Aliikangiella coralliicola]|uniref:DUF4234 domain-containing protein n=1 Tax=Aliikangiella coralliicola TaxID=2592383 RepID=A0A545UFT4_9GAMM|nr:hypothetical protein [Aliikangiella coralliicola]TQV88305.1 hypothetical protein FLL46_07200 [Aliikangiella coralliicola]